MFKATYPRMLDTLLARSAHGKAKAWTFDPAYAAGEYP